MDRLRPEVRSNIRSRGLRSSLARLFLATAIIGSVACKDPNLPSTDAQVTEFCDYLVKKRTTFSYPSIGASTAPPNRIDQINTNLLMLEEEGDHWVTNDPDSNDINPALSPDNKKIVFRREGLTQLDAQGYPVPSYSGKEGIYVINTDGSGLKRLTTEPNPQTKDDSYKWSSDNKTVVYVRYEELREETISQLYLLDTDSSESKLLLEVSAEGGSIYSPKFSPDGSKIAFADPTSTYVINKDGSNLRKVSYSASLEDGELDVSSEWLPNGRELLIGRVPQRDVEHQRKYLISSDGDYTRDVSNVCRTEEDQSE